MKRLGKSIFLTKLKKLKLLNQFREEEFINRRNKINIKH